MQSFPPCPENRDDCLLSQSGMASTNMGWTPQFKRDGTQVNEDPNWRTWDVRCSTCGRKWSACKKGSTASIEWFGGKLPGEG